MQQESKIEKYLLGHMSPSEELDFEASFVTDHDMLEQLELAQRLHQGMKLLERDQIFAENDTSTSELAWYKKRVPMWAFAASITLCVLTVYMGITEQAPKGLHGVNVVNLELATMRGDEEVKAAAKVVQLEEQTLLSMYIDKAVPTFDYERFQFVLFDESGQRVFASSSATLNNADMLHINLGYKKFEPGQYQYQLIGLENNQSQVLQSGHILFE
ncbi:hypothetical protein D210916BOD24_01200 [Alteromonas sp. D210916BOD_24]|uniref:hypothetical protein n=1 Tax=Alteromonas sp. D210916BOD_24 TaxID=3157618 RepID=UPI00399CE2D1